MIFGQNFGGTKHFAPKNVLDPRIGSKGRPNNFKKREHFGHFPK